MRFYVSDLGVLNISKNVILERNLNLDRVYLSGINIGECCLIASNTSIICHEHVYRDKDDPELPLRDDIYIGKDALLVLDQLFFLVQLLGMIALLELINSKVRFLQDQLVDSPARGKTCIRMDNKARLTRINENFISGWWKNILITYSSNTRKKGC